MLSSPEEAGDTEPELTFTQAAAEDVATAPAPPAPPSWYDNPCQAQTPGLQELGGWLANRGYYRNASNARVWRYRDTLDEGTMPIDGVLEAFSECTDHARQLATDIVLDSMLDEPNEFADLPTGHDSRIILLDTTTLTVGSHTNGARHADPDHVWSDAGSGWYPTYTQDGSGAKFLHVQPLGDYGYGSESDWNRQLSDWNADGSDMAGWTDTAREFGWRLPGIHERTGEGLRMLANADQALWILVGGYTGSGSSRQIHRNSAICGEAKELCLFAPWSFAYEDDGGQSQKAEGTSVAAAQVAAAIDNVLLLWPDYELLDVRDLMFDCAEDMGEEGIDSMWGRGILSVSCLFTPSGQLRDPRTGAILSGGIYGPLAGHDGNAWDTRFPSGASIPGVDRTGRDFAYSFVRPLHRENHALLAATALVDGAGPINLWAPDSRVPGRSVAFLENGGFSARIAATGDAVGASLFWRTGGIPEIPGLLTFQGGLALQQEGAGSLIGTGAFRAPATFSSAFSLAFQHSFTARLSLLVRGQYWMTLDTQPRSLWAGAQLSEFRATAALTYRSGGVRSVLQAQYGGSVSGRLNVAGRSIDLARHQAMQFGLRIEIPFGRLAMRSP